MDVMAVCGYVSGYSRAIALSSSHRPKAMTKMSPKLIVGGFFGLVVVCGFFF